MKGLDKDQNFKDELLPNVDEASNVSLDPSSQAELDSNQLATEFPKKELTEEDIRLGGKPPLKTICYLSAGPLVSQFTSALYGIVNTIWISKAIGDKGLSAIALYQNFDFLGRAFALFFQVSAATKIASLFGESLYNEASQVFVDLLRFSLFFAVAVPACFIPLSKICVRWFGADEEITNFGFEYIVPNLALTIIPCIFLIGCGTLQAEGRSWIFSLTQVIALCLNMFVFCPLFLLGFKMSIAGAAYATGLAEIIPGIMVVALFFFGKFGIKPKFAQFKNRISPHSWESLKLGAAQLVLQVSYCIPGLIVRKLFGLSTENDPEVFNSIMAAYNTFNRVWLIELAVPNAINVAFIPAAAYANGAKRYMRVVWLLVHALWISIIWCALSMILTVGLPIPVAKIFSDTPDYLYWCKKILVNGNLASFINEVPGIITSLLQAMKLGNQATILSIIVQLLPIPVIAILLYITDKHNVPRLIYCYPLQTVFGTLVSIPFVVFPLRRLLKQRHNDNSNEEQPTIKDGNELETIDENGSNGQKKMDTPTIQHDKSGNFVDDTEKIETPLDIQEL